MTSLSAAATEAVLHPALPVEAEAAPGRAPRRLQVQWIDDLPGLEALRPEWDELLGASPSDGLFLSWEWLVTCCKHFARDRQPRLIAIRQNGELMALAPLCQPSPPGRWHVPLLPPSLALIGAGPVGSDYLDVIVRDGFQGPAIETLADELHRTGAVVNLAQLPRAGSSAAALATALQGRGWSVLSRTTNVCPFIDLSPGSWDGYLASLGRRHRENLRRRLRKLHGAFDVRLETVRTEERLPAALDTLFHLHACRWRGREATSALDDPALRAFHRELGVLAARRGWLRLHLLHLDEQPVAALYGFRYRDRFLFYQSGFDPSVAAYGVALVIMGLAIRAAIEEGVREYDLLHGDEPYKLLWARNARDLVLLQLYPPSMGGAVARHIRLVTCGAKDRLRSLRRVDAVRDARARIHALDPESAP